MLVFLDSTCVCVFDTELVSVACEGVLAEAWLSQWKMYSELQTCGGVNICHLGDKHKSVSHSSVYIWRWMELFLPLAHPIPLHFVCLITPCINVVIGLWMVFPRMFENCCCSWNHYAQTSDLDWLLNKDSECFKFKQKTTRTKRGFRGKTSTSADEKSLPVNGR